MNHFPDMIETWKSWQALESMATAAAAATAVAAAIAAILSAVAAKKANEAAERLLAIENERLHNERSPRFKITCEPWTSGNQETLRLRVELLGPSALDQIDRLSLSVRNDNFLRGAERSSQLARGPSAEEVSRLIWGPYRLTPKVRSGDFTVDEDGRRIDYDSPLPLGEELAFQMEKTAPGLWMTGLGHEAWQRERGAFIRLSLTVEREPYGKWYIPFEIDTTSLPSFVTAPE